MDTESKSAPCLVLFDGDCNFCNGIVEFLQKRDHGECLYFVPSRSEAGEEIMRRHGISPQEAEQTVIAVENSRDRGHERISSRSTATLAIASRLSLPWRLLGSAPFRHIPRPLRDAVYNTISENRRWAPGFRVPPPEQRPRQLVTHADLEAFYRGWEAPDSSP